MKIYNRENINLLDWEAHIDGAYAKNYLLPMIEGSAQDFIQNANCLIEIFSFQQHLFPIVLGNPKAKNNSYVCSPYAQYIRYGKREMEIEFPNKFLFRIFSKFILNALGLICKMGNFDKVVYINNWLLSTNLYHSFELNQIDRIKHFLIAQYPHKTIVFRSVNEDLNKNFCEKLKSVGFLDVLSRQVYLVNAKDQLWRKKKNSKIDLHYFEKLKDYEWTDSGSITDNELPTIKKLYDDLYIKKYSSINPQFTIQFIENALKTGILTFQVFRHCGKIVAVIGFYIRDGVMTNPFVGYDTTYPASAALYRMLTLQSIKESERLGIIFNMSSGASKFKITRGAHASIEYNMVYISHLKLMNKLPWKILKWLTHKVILPIMKKHTL